MSPSSIFVDILILITVFELQSKFFDLTRLHNTYYAIYSQKSNVALVYVLDTTYKFVNIRYDLLVLYKRMI